jgi:hypothetical protein
VRSHFLPTPSTMLTSRLYRYITKLVSFVEKEHVSLDDSVRRVSDTTSSRETRQIQNLLSEPSGADGGLEAEGEREEEGEGNRKQ